MLLIDDVDAQLRPLAAALSGAGDDSRLLVSFAWWELPAPADLLPAHLHLRWPGQVGGLSANATAALIPRELSLLEQVQYGLGDAAEARRLARAASHQRAAAEHSLRMADWEGAARDEEQRVRAFPANTYIAIDTVDADGDVRHGARPPLRGMRRKQGLRPAILVPARGPLTEEAADVLRACDIVVVEAQRVRGLRRLATIRTVVRATARRYVLVVAASPMDLLTLSRECELPPECRVVARGTVPAPPVVEVVPVCRSRITTESSFEFATMRDPADSPTADRLIRLATNAWWAACQSLGEMAEEEPEVALLRAVLSQCARDEPEVARRYSHVLDILGRASEGRDERRDAVVDAVLRASRHGDVLVLTRNGRTAHALGETIARRLGVTREELLELGVRVQPFRWLPFERPAAVVTAGYFGLDTVDTALTAGTRFVTLVTDPIEARAGAFGIGHLLRLLDDVKHPMARATLEAFVGPLTEAAAASTTATRLDLDLLASASLGEPVARDAAGGVVADRVIITTTDGERIDVAGSARFESLPPGRLRLVTKRATELESGDRVALLMSDIHAGFSDRLLALLDAGALSADAQLRDEWLTIVRAVVETAGWSARHLVERLAASGHAADRATVRAWISPHADAPTAPRHRAMFHALAQALDLALPTARLDRYFDAIRRWRTLHRKAGRTLARAIRAASLGRVDASSTVQLRREWGIETEELLLATRIVVVDEVFAG